MAKERHVNGPKKAQKAGRFSFAIASSTNLNKVDYHYLLRQVLICAMTPLFDMQSNDLLGHR